MHEQIRFSDQQESSKKAQKISDFDNNINSNDLLPLDITIVAKSH